MKTLALGATILLTQTALAQMPDLSKLSKSIPAVSGATTSAGAPGASAPTTPTDANSMWKMASDKAVVHLNSATPAQLQKIPGLSAENANAIVAARPFKSVTDLVKVKGISQSVYAKIKPYVKL